MTQSEAARIFVDETVPTVPTLEESIDNFVATANRIADELIAERKRNDGLVVALQLIHAKLAAVSHLKRSCLECEILLYADAALGDAKP